MAKKAEKKSNSEEKAPKKKTEGASDKKTASSKTEAVSGAKPKPVANPKEKPKDRPKGKKTTRPKPVAKPKKVSKIKKKGKKKSKDEEQAEIVDEDEEEKEYVVKAKPKLDDATRAAMKVRRDISNKRPDFYRQEWYRYKRLPKQWRKPRGSHSKRRVHTGYRVNVARVGYRGPREARGLHPSGFEEVLVHNPRELRNVDPEKQAARIGHGVGSRKRDLIINRADEKGIRILNREA